MARPRHGMALAAPGGFSRGNFASADCALCGCWVMMGNGWLHVLTSSVVCPMCMVDPWREESHAVYLDAHPGPPRYVGERIAAEVRAAMVMPAA